MSSDILVVDDEADIRDLVAGILQDDGYSVRTAHNAEAALAARTIALESSCKTSSQEPI